MQSVVEVPIDSISLEGLLTIPEKPIGVVLFVHGSGSSRHSPRNNFVAEHLNKASIATLLIDLLSEKEDTVYETRFDIDLLTERVVAIVRWIQKNPDLNNLPISLFGASTGAAAALKVAAMLPGEIDRVVSRGGRPDLALDALEKVQTPTLLIVGAEDHGVIELNEEAFVKLKGPKELKLVDGATHLFEESGCLEEVAELSADWLSAD